MINSYRRLIRCFSSTVGCAQTLSSKLDFRCWDVVVVPGYRTTHRRPFSGRRDQRQGLLHAASMLSPSFPTSNVHMSASPEHAITEKSLISGAHKRSPGFLIRVRARLEIREMLIVHGFHAVSAELSISLGSWPIAARKAGRA